MVELTHHAHNVAVSNSIAPAVLRSAILLQAASDAFCNLVSTTSDTERCVDHRIA